MIYIVYYADDGPGDGLHQQDIETTSPWHRLYTMDYDRYIEFIGAVEKMKNRKNARIVRVFNKMEYLT